MKDGENKNRGEGCLLAVDVGLRTGLALFGADGRLQWYRSQHFARVGGLKRRAYSLLQELNPLSWLVLEGGGPRCRGLDPRGRAPRAGIATDSGPGMADGVVV